MRRTNLQKSISNLTCEEYARVHSERRKTLLGDFTNNLASLEIFLDEAVIDNCLFGNAERALLVPAERVFIGWDCQLESGKINLVIGEHAQQDWLQHFPRAWWERLDKEVTDDYYPENLFKQAMVSPSKPTDERVNNFSYFKNYDKRYFTEYQHERDCLIDLLHQLVCRHGVQASRLDVDRWLIFCAKRALLIDISAGQIPPAQLFFQPVFFEIDMVFEEYYQEHLFWDLISVSYEKRPTQDV